MYKKKNYMKQRESVYSWTSLQRPPWGVLNKSQCMDFLSVGTKKYGRCREVAVSGEGSTVFKNTAENHDIIHIPVEFYNLY